MNKRGSVPMFVCAAVPAIALLGGFTINQTRVWLVEGRLQMALDAGSLAAARDMTRLTGSAADKAAAEKNIKALVASIYNENAPGSAPVTEGDIAVSVTGTDKVEVSGGANVKNPVTGGTKRVTRSSTANPSVTGMELALVIDITLSMSTEDGSAGNKTRIRAARDAATDFLGILYNDNPERPADNRKWLSNLFISVVPFNVAVNYGAANKHFLAEDPPASAYKPSWSGTTPTWGGCAEMRSASLLDASPRSAGAGLRHYFWPSTYDAAVKHIPNSSQSGCRVEAAYVDTREGNPSGAHRVCMGHNDWTAPEYVLSGAGGSGDKQNRLIAAFASNSTVRRVTTLDVWKVAHGPNMMCPPDTGDRKNNLTVLPLTRDRETVQARLDRMVELPFSYGTNIASGLQAGWFTLSPNWRQVDGGFAGWPTAEPQPDARDPRPALPRLPLDYGAANMRKVMVLLTDGDNVWANARDIQGSTNSLVRPESRRTEGFYGSYGYFGADYPTDDRPTATSTSDAASKIDAAAEDWCKKIKATTAPDGKGPEKITLYTIGLGANLSSEALTVLRNCASVGKDGKPLFYRASQSSDLKKVFTAIGNELTSLRLTQ